jgi:DNA end-binding protein Ku
MKGKGMVGLGRVVISKRERPIILEAYGKGIRAVTLRYPYEVRKEDEYFADIPDVKISGEMLKLAEHIVEMKTDEFDPSEFIDRYETAVVELLKSKQAGIPRSAKPTANAPSNVVSLMDALKRSIQADGKKTKSKAPSIVPAMPKPKKKARA